MAFTLKDSLAQLKRVKNLGLISAVLVIGILLCMAGDITSLNSGSGKTVKADIERLCVELTGNKVYVSVNTDHSDRLVGIAVILKEGDSATLRLKLTEMLSTLYAIPASRIYVTS